MSGVHGNQRDADGNKPCSMQAAAKTITAVNVTCAVPSTQHPAPIYIFLHISGNVILARSTSSFFPVVVDRQM